MLRQILYTQSHCCWQILTSTTELKPLNRLNQGCHWKIFISRKWHKLYTLNQIYNFVFFKISIDTLDISSCCWSDTYSRFFISFPFIFLLSVWDETVYLVGHGLNVFVRDVFSCILDFLDATDVKPIPLHMKWSPWGKRHPSVCV